MVQTVIIPNDATALFLDLALVCFASACIARRCCARVLKLKVKPLCVLIIKMRSGSEIELKLIDYRGTS